MYLNISVNKNAGIINTTYNCQCLRAYCQKDSFFFNVVTVDDAAANYAVDVNTVEAAV